MSAPARLQRHTIRLMRWAALFALAAAAVALILLARGDPGARAYRFIAISLGVGLGALLGMGLLALGSFAKAQDRGISAANSPKKEDHDLRP